MILGAAKFLAQLINLGTTPIPLSNHTTIAGLYVVTSRCFSGARPGVEAICAPLQAAMTPLNDKQYRQLLEKLASHFQDYPLPQ